IALLTSIVDFLPFIGTGIVFIPWIIYLFFTDHFTLTIFISMLYMIIIIQRQLSEPKIVSKSIGLPPLVTLRSEEHTSELQSRFDLVCRLLLEKKNIPK